MKILIATDSFKGSASAAEVAKALRNGLMKTDASFDLTCIELGDGGEGTRQALVSSGLFEHRLMKAHGTQIDSMPFGWQPSSGTAYLESADFIGLHDPYLKGQPILLRNSSSLGLALRQIVQIKPQKIMIGLGGTGTHDWGLGMAAALGYRFLDQFGCEVEEVPRSIFQIDQLVPPDKPAIPVDLKLCWLSDITALLRGKDGAAREYAAQKGATAREIDFLELGGHHLAKIALRDLKRDFEVSPGAAAAGGLGFGGLTFLGGHIESGSAEVLRVLKVREILASVDVLITGEGRFDRQSLQGKLVGRLLDLAKASGKPCVVVSGSKPKYEVGHLGLKGLIVLEKYTSNHAESIRDVLRNLEERAAKEIAELITAD